MITIKDINVKMPAVKPGEKQEITWKFEGKKEDIVHIQPACGCTAEITWTDDEILAVYTADSVEALKSKAEKGGSDLETQYPSGKYPIVKGLSIYLNDGKDLKILNDRGFEVWNTEKERKAIQFNGYIEYK